MFGHSTLDLLQTANLFQQYHRECLESAVAVFFVWLGSLTVTCRTCNPEVTQGRRFEYAPGHYRVTTLGKLFTHMCLCHQAV